MATLREKLLATLVLDSNAALSVTFNVNGDLNSECDNLYLRADELYAVIVALKAAEAAAFKAGE